MNIDFIRCETCPGRVPVVCDYCFRCPECCGTLHKNDADCWECAECQAIAESITEDDFILVDGFDDDADLYFIEDDEGWLFDITSLVTWWDDDIDELLWEVD
jgi:hypothetical protein